MRYIIDAPELRAAVVAERGASTTIGLVPTMGYLHAGHLALLQAARAECDLVVMSLFVNPTQFGPNEDYERYPRDAERDQALAAEAGVDIVFAPTVETMYPGGVDGQAVWVEPGQLATHLCGATRPGHFRGVLTVVAKLFHLVEPDRAYFGAKDGQQAALVARMVRDLAFPLTIRRIATVREPDGLALSSRNVFLSREERAQAPALAGALEAVQQAVERGERDPRRLEAMMRECLSAAPLARLEYATVVDLETLAPAVSPLRGESMAALAVHFGGTRLIDNVRFEFENVAPVSGGHR